MRAHAKLWIEEGGKVALSDWRVALLEAVEHTGSLSNAARSLRVPYRTAWYKMREVEASLGMRLLATQSGGPSGGGSTLTPAARDIIVRYHQLQEGIDDLVARRFEDLFADLRREGGKGTGHGAGGTGDEGDRA